MNSRFSSALFAAILLAGCASRQPAPVSERAQPPPISSSISRNEPGTKPAPEPMSPAVAKVHVVQKGETLIAVALQHGVDYRELAAWNNIENVNLIHVGQEIRLSAPGSEPPPAPASGVVATPLQTGSAPVARPIDAPTSPAGTPLPSTSGVKTGPLAVKLPYSEKALADLEAESRSAAGQPGATQAIAQSASAPATAQPLKTDDEKIEWAWPAKGKVLSSYTDASKGMDIAGAMNAPVLAAADGKVMYSGTGIRGYGKLVILKHSNVFLSAYAHNQNIVVKEGQDVKRGQKIAEMGSTDTDQVKLHFEIRKQGKPVDPAKFLPAS